jgi:hypothetical protein
VRECRFGVGAALCLGLLCGKAGAEEFSVLCNQGPGSQFYFTFDDLTKRVIEYDFIDGNSVGLIFTGAIKTTSAEEIRFDLSVYSNPNVRLGDFTLNRKEGWLESSRSNYQEKQNCQPTTLRTVMDIWRIFPHDP